MRIFLIIFAFIVVTGVAIFGFRGTTTTRPPIEIFPDMDRQARYKTQGESEFFADGRADRLPVAGTVARGQLREDDHHYRGLAGEDQFAQGFPGIVSREMMDRGRQRYQIHCAPCHGATGNGQGITTQYGMVAVPDFHTDRLRDLAEGEIFEVISNGRGLMGPYSGKITVEDRWNIIAYLRALQRAHQGSVEDVPADKRAELGL
jgi:mono/diheme cytochrome c family protein